MNFGQGQWSVFRNWTRNILDVMLRSQSYKCPTYAEAQHDPSSSTTPRIHYSRPSCQLVQFTQRCAYTTSSALCCKLPSSQGESRAAHLLTDPLPAILAFDRMLDDGIIGRPPINERDGIQRDTDADEVENFVDESTR